MNLKLWRAKRLTKGIWKAETRLIKFQSYVTRIKEWIKKDKKQLNKYLLELSPEDNLLYGYQMGFITQTEYEEDLKKLNSK